MDAMFGKQAATTREPHSLLPSLAEMTKYCPPELVLVLAPILLFHPHPRCTDLVPIIMTPLTMITSFIRLMPKLNATP